MTSASDIVIAAVTSTGGVDFLAVARLNILAWGRQPGEDEVRARAVSLEKEVAGLDPNRRGIFLAVRSVCPIGFCRVFQDAKEPAHWWLAGIVVHPDHRRRGIGRALTVQAIAHARSRGAKVIRSETHADNTISIRFHEGLGFTNNGGFTALDGDKKIAFSLELKGADNIPPATRRLT